MIGRCVRMAGVLIIGVACAAIMGAGTAEAGRWETELSGDGWRVWRDTDADWIGDRVHMPPVDIGTLPVHPPTCGWDALPLIAEKTVSVPGTVEEHFWGANGNPFGTAGDYRGVSWWSRTFRPEQPASGARIVLAFESVNLRAEVFVNRRLVGYDTIGNTPFTVDITDAVRFDAPNELDIRITDPVGNFTWNDNELLDWGPNKVPGVHGFGGITGRVFLRALPQVSITDIWVRNTPAVTAVDVTVTIDNTTSRDTRGVCAVVVSEWKDPDRIVWRGERNVSVGPDGVEVVFTAKAGDARLWSIDEPNLYVAQATFDTDDASSSDSWGRRFGFRWFEVGEKDGDKRFYLNGRRVFVFAAMSRGFWPKNGIFPTPEMARRDIDTARGMGYNTAKFHRAVGQHRVTEYCDEVGHLAFEEPGGYRSIPGPDATTRVWRREKLRRMIMRDRSYPSLILYNFKNEASKSPSEDDIANMRMVHTLDPTRIVTYNSDRNRSIAHTERIDPDPIKLHMLPDDDTLRYSGWFDQHHWIRHVGWIDDYYENPRFYLRGVVNQLRFIAREDSLYRLDPGEIIFWGEEGAGGSMWRLGKIKAELARTGATGWREQAVLDYHDYYERFLDESGFRRAFPTVDDLTLAMGENLHYYHGRALENVRMSNVADAYILNGWASGGTHSDMVDAYRNPTGDPSILAHYAQPLYVAVKLRDTSVPTGFAPVADCFLINEKNVRGAHTLHLMLDGPGGKTIMTAEHRVRVLGGEEFGQLLVEGIDLPPLDEPGYYTLRAELRRGTEIVASGHDQAFVVDDAPVRALAGTIAVIDTSGAVDAFLAARGMHGVPFDPDANHYDTIIIGAHDFNTVRRLDTRPGQSAAQPIRDKVRNGARLIILDQADLWAQFIDQDALFYYGDQHWARNGRYVAGTHPFLDGLPQAQALGWEYQNIYRNDVWGIDLDRNGVDIVIAAAAQRQRKDILTALCRVPFGNGDIVLSALNLLPEVDSDEPQSAVPQRLLLNMLTAIR